MTSRLSDEVGVDKDTGASALRARAFVFADAASHVVLRRIEQLAPSDATVLVLGETGTGKEVVARQIHDLSARRRDPFVAVNCGALTESLVESELFGHERGAFTGANATKIGWFEAAAGGTLFLDEIAELSLSTQVKLLRVLQEGEVVRLGSVDARRVDVRLIAATNVPLQQSVSAGRFRADLFYRLNVAPLSLPPLRQRRGDILPLARHFLHLYADKLTVRNPSFAVDATEALLEYAWPGNIRELENVIHRALLVCSEGQIVSADLLLPDLVASDTKAVRSTSQALPAPSYEEVFDNALEQLLECGLNNLSQYIEERVIRAAHEFCGRNQVHTARLLGLSRNVVRARLIQYGEIARSSRSNPATAASRSG